MFPQILIKLQIYYENPLSFSRVVSSDIAKIIGVVFATVSKVQTNHIMTYFDGGIYI
jgi:hypothetical protein